MGSKAAKRVAGLILMEAPRKGRRRRGKAKRCRQCGRPSERLSRRGLCPRCSYARMSSAIRQLRDRKGPVYERWRTRMRAFLERLRE